VRQSAKRLDQAIEASRSHLQDDLSKRAKPLGGERFIARLERLTGRFLKPARREPKPASQDDRDSN